MTIDSTYRSTFFHGKRVMSVKRILSNVAWAGSLKIIGVIFTMAVNVLVARLLDVEAAGYYFLTASLAVFGALVARLGMRQSVVKLVARSMALGTVGTAAGVIRKILSTTLIGTVITAGIFLAASGWIDRALYQNSRHPYILFVIPWLGLLAFQSILSDVFRGFQHIDLSSLIDGVLVNTLIAAILLALYFTVRPLALGDVIAVTIGAYTLVVGFAFYLLKRRIGDFHGEDRSTYGELIGLSVPIFIVNLCTYLAAESSLWFVAYYGKTEEIAVFGVCLKLVKLVTLPLLIQNIVVTPLIVELHTTRERDKLQRLVKGAATLTAVPSVILILVFIAAGNHVLALLFGGAYADGWRILVIMSVGYLINVCSGPCNNTLMMTGYEKTIMKLFVVTTAAAIAAMALLGWRFGVTGIAVSVSAALIVHNLIAVVLARTFSGIETFATLRPTYIRGLITYLGQKRC